MPDEVWYKVYDVKMTCTYVHRVKRKRAVRSALQSRSPGDGTFLKCIDSNTFSRMKNGVQT